MIGGFGECTGVNKFGHVCRDPCSASSQLCKVCLSIGQSERMSDSQCLDREAELTCDFLADEADDDDPPSPDMDEAAMDGPEPPSPPFSPPGSTLASTLTSSPSFDIGGGDLTAEDAKFEQLVVYLNDKFQISSHCMVTPQRVKSLEQRFGDESPEIPKIDFTPINVAPCTLPTPTLLKPVMTTPLLPAPPPSPIFKPVPPPRTRTLLRRKYSPDPYPVHCCPMVWPL